MSPRKSSVAGDLRDFLDAFRVIVRALRLGSRAAERELGISSAQLFALHQLAEAPAASVNELAERTYTHQSSVSVVVRRLVEQRLVEKVTAAGDRRRVEIALTERGRRLLRRAPEPVQERLIAAIAGLDDVQRHSLAGGLQEVARLLGGDSKIPAMFFEDDTARQRGRRRRRKVAR